MCVRACVCVCVCKRIYEHECGNFLFVLQHIQLLLDLKAQTQMQKKKKQYNTGIKQTTKQQVYISLQSCVISALEVGSDAKGS